MFKSMISLLCIFLMWASCSTTQQVVAPAPMAVKKNPPPKNIILLIGDGMGLTQISAGTYTYGNTSHFERMDVVGLHKSYASDNLITDSAAGATAFACGQKTYNGAIAVDQDTMPIGTILEEAEMHGLSTGLVSTSSITHATPASFIAHNKYRKNMEEIAEDFLDTEIDFFVGGGRKHFDSREKDERDLLAELRSKDYVISSYFEEELEAMVVDPSKNFGYLTSSEEPLRLTEGRGYLRDAVKKSMAHLNNHDSKGFFLMIEGSQIDWGGHANNLDWVLNEWKEYNEIIGDVLDWAEKDGETLVVITADHETGGLAINPGSQMDSIVGAFTSTYHTGTMIPVFAKGPGADKFNGIYENTAIYDKMRAAYGWKTKPN